VPEHLSTLGLSSGLYPWAKWGFRTVTLLSELLFIWLLCTTPKVELFKNVVPEKCFSALVNVD
jgi:hypothetical protein